MRECLPCELLEVVFDHGDVGSGEWWGDEKAGGGGDEWIGGGEDSDSALLRIRL